MGDTRQGAGSAGFVQTDRNRDSLTPEPAAPAGGAVHRQVTEGSIADDFSRSRGHPVYPVSLPSRALSMSVGALAPGAKTSDHRHAYETLVYVLEGRGYSVVEGQRIEWKSGDAFYVPPWNWHQHFASEDGAVQYLASTNLPMLDSLGQTVLREERPQ